MAIKVGGTEVVDNNRQLKNIASVDATTVAALGTAGVGGGSGSYDFTSSGSVSIGDCLGLNSDGTVSKASSGKTIRTTPVQKGSIGSYTGSTSEVWYDRPNCGMVYVAGQDCWVFTFRDNSNNNYPSGVIATFDGSNWSFGTKIAFTTSYQIDHIDCATDNVNNVYFYFKTTSNYGRLGYATIDGANKTFSVQNGTGVSVESNIREPTVSYNSSDGLIYTCHRSNNNSLRPQVRNWSASLSAQSNYTFPYNDSYDPNIYIKNNGDMAITFSDGGYQYRYRGIAFQYTGGNFSVGSMVNSTTSGAYGYTMSQGKNPYDETAGRGILLHQSTRTSPQYKPCISTFTFSGTTFTWQNNRLELRNDSLVQSAFAIYDPFATRTVVLLVNQANSTKALDAMVVDPSGTPSVGTTTTIATASGTGQAAAAYGDNVVATAFEQTGTDAKVVAVDSAFNFNTLDDFVGVAAANVTNGQTVEVTTLGGINENVSGLTIGTYYSDASGNLTTSTTNYKIGKALTSTKLLVTGAA